MDKEPEQDEGREVYRGDWRAQFRFLISPESPLTEVSYISLKLPYGIGTTHGDLFIGDSPERLKEKLNKEETVAQLCNRTPTQTKYRQYSNLKINRSNYMPLQLCIYLNSGNKMAFFKQRMPEFLGLKKELVTVKKGFSLRANNYSINYPLGTTNDNKIEGRVKYFFKEIHRVAVFYSYFGAYTSYMKNRIFSEIF